MERKAISVLLVVLLQAVAVLSECTPVIDCVNEPTFQPPPPIFIPELSSFNPAQLRLYFQTSLMFSDIKIEFDPQNVGIGGQTTFCNHQVWDCSTNWQDTTESGGCNLDIIAQFPSAIDALTQCFHRLNPQDNEDYDIYESFVKFTTTQVSESIREEAQNRTIVTALPVRFQFPRTVTVSTEGILVNGAANSFSDITLQRFDVYSRKTTLHLVTSVQSPYKLIAATPSVTSNNPPAEYTVESLAAAPVEYSSNYTCALNEPCSQLWQIVVTPNSGQCLFSANVTFQFDITCNTDFEGPCSLPEAPTYVTSYSLLALDFCPEVISGVALTGSLKAYSDVAVQNPATQFGYRTFVYFLVNISSSGNVRFASTNVLQVAVNGSRSFILTQNSTLGGFTVIPSYPHPHTAVFYFRVDNTTVNYTHLLNPEPLRVSALVQVQAPSSNGQQTLMSFDFAPLALMAKTSTALATKISALPPNPNTSNNNDQKENKSSDSTTTAINLSVEATAGVFVVVAVVAIAVVAGVVYTVKRRHNFTPALSHSNSVSVSVSN